MVADFDIVDTVSNALYNTSSLVSEDDGERTLWVLAGQSVGVAG